MAKIIIKESDIVKMVTEKLAMIFEAMIPENSEYGTRYGSTDWSPFSENDRVCMENGLTEDVAEELIANGVIPEGLIRDFLIQSSQDSLRGVDDASGPYENPSGQQFYGEYDEAKELIAQVQDPKLRDILEQSLQEACEAIEYGEFEGNMPDPDEKYETQLDLGEGIDEHDPDDVDYGQVGDWYQNQAMKSVQSGRVFKSKEDFEYVSRNLELPLQSVQVYLTHGDIGLLDKQVMVEYWPASISFEGPDRSVGITVGGWIVDDIDWEYGPEETCSYQGKIQPMKRGMIKWLDDAIEKHNEERFDDIVSLFYE